jgi:Chromo (CHRromatin Organisation MOdifier) domain
MLNKGILLPPPEVPTTLIPASTKVADMILTQDTLMAQAATRLRTADDAHLASHAVAITTFAVNSFVLVQYSSVPPTRLHTKREGPFKAISSHLSEYTLLSLVAKRTRIVHASRLKTFVFDPTTQDPADTARRDYKEFFVESVSDHAGNRRRISTLTFHVKWLNHPSSANTWEPWRNLRSCERLHNYLRVNAMQRLIPRTHRDNPSS